jgi:hypothetical protein
MELLSIEKKEKTVIKIYGVEYEVKRLTWGAARKYREIKDANSNEDDVLLKMLVACGLPEEVLLELAPEEIEQIVNVLMGSKKK